mgnify:CR=1 FL=1
MGQEFISSTSLVVGHISEATDSGTSSNSSGGTEESDITNGERNIRGSVSTTSEGLLAARAVPDAYSNSLDAFLSAKLASVCGVLVDFDLLDLFTDRSTISGTVFTDDSDLLSSLSLMT